MADRNMAPVGEALVEAFGSMFGTETSPRQSLIATADSETDSVPPVAVLGSDKVMQDNRSAAEVAAHLDDGSRNTTRHESSLGHTPLDRSFAEKAGIRTRPRSENDTNRFSRHRSPSRSMFGRPPINLLDDDSKSGASADDPVAPGQGRSFGAPVASSNPFALETREHPPLGPQLLAGATVDVREPGAQVALAHPVMPVNPASCPTLPPVQNAPDFVVSQNSWVDGVAITVPAPGDGNAIVSYVSENLADFLGLSASALVGQRLTSVLGQGGLGQPEGHENRRRHDRVPLPTTKSAVIVSTEHNLDFAGTADVAMSAVCDTVVESTHLVDHPSGRRLAVHVTKSSLNGLASGASLLLVRDLARVGRSERSNSRLTREMTQVAAVEVNQAVRTVVERVETRFGGDARCWIGLASTSGPHEVVTIDRTDPAVVSRAVKMVMESRDACTDRCIRVADLPPTLSFQLEAESIHALWAFPIATQNSGASVPAREGTCGVMIVAHSTDAIPTGVETRFCERMTQLVSSAVGTCGAAPGTDGRGSSHDALTQLPNRHLILDRLRDAMAELDSGASSLSVLLVDINRFKGLNQVWGNLAGDQVLVELASRLLTTVRLGDTVGRISGDQFLMVCLADAELDPTIVARRVIGQVAKPIELSEGGELRVTASVGVVSVEDSSTDPASIIGQAEAALAVADAEGAGRYVLYDEGISDRAWQRQELEQALHYAIKNDELVVYYQPVCEVDSGRMIGAEALVRWDRPGHGLQNPADFIGLAEETGLIVPLGEWVIRRVAQDLYNWPRSSGFSPVVTVNLSARQLSEPGLVTMVTEILESYDLSPIRMGFEVTESMAVEDIEVAVATLDELSELGCRIAVDDFGIGHATLDYLRRFSMAYALKLDRSFVAGLGRSKEDTAIVTATLALAKALDMRVVAEGVETLSQLNILTELKCDYAQGYAFSQPLPMEKVLDLWLDVHLQAVDC